jgi:hypothetical protein
MGCASQIGGGGEIDESIPGEALGSASGREYHRGFAKPHGGLSVTSSFTSVWSFIYGGRSRIGRPSSICTPNAGTPEVSKEGCRRGDLVLKTGAAQSSDPQFPSRGAISWSSGRENYGGVLAGANRGDQGHEACPTIDPCCTRKSVGGYRHFAVMTPGAKGNPGVRQRSEAGPAPSATRRDIWW